MANHSKILFGGLDFLNDQAAEHNYPRRSKEIQQAFYKVPTDIIPQQA